MRDRSESSNEIVDGRQPEVITLLSNFHNGLFESAPTVPN